MTGVLIVCIPVLSLVAVAALLLADRRRRLRHAIELLTQLEEERRARAAAERRLARAEKALVEATAQLNEEHHERERMTEVERIHAAVRRVLPAGTAPIAVVSRGDEDLIRFDGHVGWHFPQTEDGDYAGYHPADSDAAIAELEDVRRRGAGYLLIPGSSSWWLEHYAGLRDYIAKEFRPLEVGDGIGVLVELSSERARNRAVSLIAAGSEEKPR